MAFGGFGKGGDGAPMAEINMVPLIDVMLVLLVIFIITAPLLTHAVKIDLPQASSQPARTKPQTAQLGIRADGSLYWNGETLDRAAIEGRMQAAAAADAATELHIRADRAAAYEQVAAVMSAAARAGITRIGFVTDPATSRGQ